MQRTSGTRQQSQLISRLLSEALHLPEIWEDLDSDTRRSLLLSCRQVHHTVKSCVVNVKPVHQADLLLLAHWWPSLEKLDLSFIKLSDASLQCFVAASLPKIKILLLRFCSLSSTAVGVLVTSKWPRLLMLDISCNRLPLVLQKSYAVYLVGTDSHKNYHLCTAAKQSACPQIAVNALTHDH